MKVILITRASSGIGLATAQCFSKVGWKAVGTLLHFGSVVSVLPAPFMGSYVVSKREQSNAVQKSIEMALAREDDPQVVAKAELDACRGVNTKVVVDVGKNARTQRRLSWLFPTEIFGFAFRKQFGLT